MKTFKELFGERIQSFRIKAGFPSQQALAEAMGIDRARVSDWERGKHEPKGELRITLLRLIKASENEIFGTEPGARPLENTRLKKKISELQTIIDSVDPDVWKHWEGAAEDSQALCLFLLTWEDKYRAQVSKSLWRKLHRLSVSRPPKSHF